MIRNLKQFGTTLRWHDRWKGEVKRVDDLRPDEIKFWKLLNSTRSEFRSPFFSFEFTKAVSASFESARVCLLYENDTLAGIFPFQFAGRFERMMGAGERIGGQLSDFFGILIDHSASPITGEALLRCAGLQSFNVSHMEEAQSRFGLAFSTFREGARIRVANGADHYWNMMKKKHPRIYSNLRNRERKITREHRLMDFVFANEPANDMAQRVIEEKRKQYVASGAGDGLIDSWKLRCLDQISKYREGCCLPVVSSLYLDGTWAAMHFGIRAGSVLHYWFPVYNPEFRTLSPGMVLLSQIISEAPHYGIDEIDLGEGVSDYKEWLATERYQSRRAVWRRNGPRGFAYRGYLSLRWRVDKYTTRP